MATTFTLVDDGDGKFVLDGNIVRTAALLDYETATSHAITVAATGVANQTLTINVTDVDIPTMVLSNSTIAEDIANGTIIGALSVLEGHGSYTFTVISDPDDLFTIDSDDLDKTGFVDYEVSTSHEVTIQADNGVDPPFSQTFTITVTNVADTTEPPEPTGIVTSMIIGRGLTVSQTATRQYISGAGLYVNEVF